MGFLRGVHNPCVAQQPPVALERKCQIMSLFPAQVPVQSWFDDMADTELLNLIPVFEELSGADDVYTSLGQLRAP